MARRQMSLHTLRIPEDLADFVEGIAIGTDGTVVVSFKEDRRIQIGIDSSDLFLTPVYGKVVVFRTYAPDPDLDAFPFGPPR